MNTTRFIIFLMVILLAACSPSPKFLKNGETSLLWEGFENRLAWTYAGKAWNEQNDAALGVALSASNKSEGKAALLCPMESVPGKVSGTFLTDSPDVVDWTDVLGVAIDFYNSSDKDVNAAVAFCTGNSWVWQESLTESLTPGKNLNVRFDLQNNTLKSAVTNWEHTTSLLEPEDVKRVVIKYFLPENLKVDMYVDNIRFIKLKKESDK